MSSLLTIAPRKPEPADIAYTYETVQGDRARATTLDISRLILAGPYAQQNGFVRLPNVRYQRSVEMVVRRYRRRRLVEVVDLPGCSLEEVFGKPVFHLDRNVSLLTKGGFRVSLRRQYHPPQHIPRRATRTLNLVDLFVIDERPKPKGGVERPVSTADAQLVSPTPKDLNVDWIAVTNHKYSSPTPTHGPYRLGPLTLRIRVTQLLWSLENTEMVRLPIENAVSYVQVGTNRDGG